ncbi:hypothetical protein CsSME_00030700 [Camellia sinensis var. sinensis]
MGFCFGSISKLTTCAIVVLFLLSSFGFTSTDAFDALIQTETSQLSGIS